MSKAETDNTPDPFAGYPSDRDTAGGAAMTAVRRLAQIENNLLELRGTAGLLVHLSASEVQPNPEELNVIHAKLMDLHDELRDAWKAAWDERKVEREHYAAELAETRATFAPGSPEDLRTARALWAMVRSGAEAVLRACEEEEAKRVHAQLAEASAAEAALSQGADQQEVQQ